MEIQLGAIFVIFSILYFFWEKILDKLIYYLIPERIELKGEVLKYEEKLVNRYAYPSLTNDFILPEDSFYTATGYFVDLSISKYNECKTIEVTDDYFEILKYNYLLGNRIVSLVCKKYGWSKSISEVVEIVL